MEPSPIHFREEGELVKDGVNLTICEQGHEHFCVRHGRTYVIIIFRDDEPPVISVERDPCSAG